MVSAMSNVLSAGIRIRTEDSPHNLTSERPLNVATFVGRSPHCQPSQCWITHHTQLLSPCLFTPETPWYQEIKISSQPGANTRLPVTLCVSGLSRRGHFTTWGRTSHLIWGNRMFAQTVTVTIMISPVLTFHVCSNNVIQILPSWYPSVDTWVFLEILENHLPRIFLLPVDIELWHQDVIILMNVFATKKLSSYKPVRMSFVRIRLLPSAFGSETTWDCAQIFKLKKFSNRWENVSRSLMDHFSIPHWIAMSTLRMQRTKTEYLFAMKCRLQLNQLKIFHSDVCIF